jgi:hypothetical protein
MYPLSVEIFKIQHMELLIVFGLVSAITVWAFISTYLRYKRTSLAYLQGPESNSFFLGMFRIFFSSIFWRIWRLAPGHAKELLLPECGETEAKWQSAYGAVFRIKGGLGVTFSAFYCGFITQTTWVCRKIGYTLQIPKLCNIFCRGVDTTTWNFLAITPQRDCQGVAA